MTTDGRLRDIVGCLEDKIYAHGGLVQVQVLHIVVQDMNVLDKTVNVVSKNYNRVLLSEKVFVSKGLTASKEGGNFLCLHLYLFLIKRDEVRTDGMINKIIVNIKEASEIQEGRIVIIEVRYFRHVRAFVNPDNEVVYVQREKVVVLFYVIVLLEGIVEKNIKITIRIPFILDNLI